jgi:hypothetical protein
MISTGIKESSQLNLGSEDSNGPALIADRRETEMGSGSVREATVHLLVEE